MVPLLIGAAVVGAGAVLLSDDKPQEQPVTQNKHTLSKTEEQQTMRRLKRAGRIKTIGDVPTQSNFSGITFVPSGNFSNDFERIESFIDNPNIDNEFIGRALNAIERRAMRDWNDNAVNFVAYYREKLRNRNISSSTYSNFDIDFMRIDNMLSRGFDVCSIKNELQLIELRAKNRRDAATMNKLGLYYQKIYCVNKAEKCFALGKTYAVENP